MPAPDAVRYQGTIVASVEGPPTLETDEGLRLSLFGDLGGFRIGDEISVEGRFVEFTAYQQSGVRVDRIEAE